jgi:hypothetical protein
MKRMLLLALCFVCVSSMVFAQLPGSIGVFADAAAANCNFVDGGSLVVVHIVHVSTYGATASRFMLEVSSAGWMHLGDTWDFPTVIGTSITGVSVAYGACLEAPIHLGQINFLGTIAPPCTYIRIVPDPAALSGKIEAVDCAQTKMFPTGGEGFVNPTFEPGCGCVVPVEETTWGGVKALYR